MESGKGEMRPDGARDGRANAGAEAVEQGDGPYGRYVQAFLDHEAAPGERASDPRVLD